MDKKSKSPPDLDKYLVEREHRFITYEEGAREYGMTGVISRETILKEYVDKAREIYDFVIID